MGRVIVAGGAPNMTVPSKSSNLPEIGTPLNDMTWADVRAISDAGLASSYFDVGDRKAVTLNGTVGSLSLNGTYYCYIIGIDHNSAIEGTNRIHFQIGKTTSGTDIAFCDSNYNKADSSNGFKMNLSNTNVGGWNESYGRKTLLGNSGTPTSPPANSFMAALPADLRVVMKPVTKYTDNTGGGSNSSGAVTATTDYLFFLSEFEVQGSRLYANKYERNYQAQYDYYKAGNSKVKYRHDATGVAVYHWCRSAYYDSRTNFCSVYDSGAAYAAYAYRSSGFAPAFCV